MYQTNIQNQLFSAALPLKPLTAWAGSACSVTVAVPPAPALAGLGVSSVSVTLTLPDGHTVAAAAVQVPGTPLWVATFAPDEFATAGHVARGLMITVAGTDEHNVVRTWIIAKGDVDVMDGDAAPVSGGSYYAVKLRDAAPEDPVEGDAYVSDGALLIYHDGEWVTIGDVDISGKLDGAAAYPAWEEREYDSGSIVSYNGRLWRAGEDTAENQVPDDSPAWSRVTIGVLKQDALGYTPENAANKKALTSTRPDNTNDYPTAQSVFDALALKASLSDLRYDLVSVQSPGASVQLRDRASTSVSLTLEVSSETGWTWSDGVDRGAPTRHEDPCDGYVSWSYDGMNYYYEDGDTVWFYYEYYNEEYGYSDTVYVSATQSTVYSIDTVIPAFTMPDPVTGKARDLVLDLTLDASALEGTGLEMPAISFSPGTGGTFLTDDGDFPAPEVGRNLYSFTEVAQNVFAVSRRTVEAVS